MLLPVLLLAYLNSCTEKEKIKPPNIIFIMSDDHANRAISAYGSNLIETPNIDRLAEEGMLLRRAYCNYPVCGASRASLMPVPK